MYGFMSRYMSWVHMPSITVTDIIEIIIIAIVLYYVLAWVKSTRAWQLFKGLLVIIVFLIIAAIVHMDTILWIAGKVLNVAVIGILILFQPELRGALERLGRQNFFSSFIDFDFAKNTPDLISERTINELVKGCFEMGRVCTGALIVIERDIKLDEYIRTGINVDASVSSQLLINIFEHNTPLHDGAVIVRDDRIMAATCYLPLSDNMGLSKELGTRHRAAVGMSEVSDSLTIIVSEETGAVSVACDRQISRNLSPDELKDKLREIAGTHTVQDNAILTKIIRGLKDVKQSSKKDNK